MFLTVPVLGLAPVIDIQGDAPFPEGGVFGDVSGHWAENHIMYCYDQGLINIYEDGLLLPNVPITRAEFAYSIDNWITKNTNLLTRLDFRYELRDIRFTDVPRQDPFYESIMSVASIGLMVGADGLFRPEESLTRQEASTIWENLFGMLYNTTIDEDYFARLDTGGVLGRFEDAHDIAPWAIDAVAVMTDKGFVGGYPDSTFRPSNSITRAEAYVVLANIELNLINSMKVFVPDFNESDPRLIRVLARNADANGFDLEFTVNDAAVSAGARVLAGMTTSQSLAVTEDNFKDLDGFIVHAFELHELDAVSVFAFQSVYSTQMSAVFPNVYYIYAMLEWDTGNSGIIRAVAGQSDVSVAAVLAAGTYSLAISAGGSLYAWGDNLSGQLGDGLNVPRMLPHKVLDNVSAVSGGEGGSVYALTHDGGLWAWGDNSGGRLGIGLETVNNSPLLVMANIESLYQDGGSVFAVTAGGGLWAWGGNRFGRLGDGTVANHALPVLVLEGVAAVAAGNYYATYAVLRNGELWGWGNNEFGQLGDGTDGNRTRPAKIMDGVASVYPGANRVYALKTNGELWGWGSNNHGALGTCSDDPGFLTQPVKIMDGVTSVFVNTDHTFAINVLNELWGWGSNRYGELGLNDTDGLVPLPRRIMPNISSISSGNNHTLALGTNGDVWSWGQNHFGQLGRASEGPEPARVLRGAARISAAGDSSFIVTASGELWGWGYNSSFQLGDGTDTSREYPVRIMIH